MNETIRKRSEVPVEDTWNLGDIFADDGLWQEALEELKGFVPQLEAFRGHLGDSAESLLGYLRLNDEISVKLGKVYGYASCRSDEDTAVGVYQNMKGQAMGVLVKLQSASAFESPEILAIDEEKLERFFAERSELETYRRPLYSIRRRAAHTLSEKEERLLSMAGEMGSAPGSLDSVFHNASLRYSDAVDAEGGKHPLTDGSLVMLLTESDRTLRRSAFENFYAVLDQFKATCAALLDAQFKALRFESEARGYAGTLEAALDGTEVPTSVYHNLISAVHENLEPMYRYVRLRRKLLGVDELHMYDVYTPLVPDCSVTVPFAEAKETVLEALSVLGEDYTALLKQGFENRWIDVYQNEGKRSGAYSTDVSRPHPYVLLNYKGTLDDMFTLAHEMGHALHSYHSTAAQPVCTSDYVIFVAEVASTCNEVLLMRHMLEKTTEPKQRAYLINHFLDSFKGTVYRQTMFAEFERFMGELSDRGETLTDGVLCEKYLELNRLYFGPDMVSDSQIALEWARIPHFFYDYYVFQYATGFSAAVAIAERILREGESAVADYKRFLSGGCSADPISLLKLAGVDMSTPEPVNAGL
ncbi:MAG: oligoendopeptidase F, partial [Oscillospiraceae bacterium]|nr:oligoendopeptidase F [Oscillospiraceae bacterium]